MSREQLGDLYARHHAAGARYGFIYGGADRVGVLAPLVGRGRRVLTRHYLDGNDVTGVDVDRGALEACARDLGIATRWADVGEGLPCRDAEFDVVVAAELVEHLPAPEAFVAEVARVLRPGGTFVGSVPNAFRLKNRLLFLTGREFELDPTHLHHFSPWTLRALLGTRFEDIELRFAASRLLFAWPRMFGNCMVWRCRKRG
jgi:SAM-dependent methyltransferase